MWLILHECALKCGGMRLIVNNKRQSYNSDSPKNLKTRLLFLFLQKNYFFYCGDYNIVTSFSLSFPPSEPSYIPLLFSFKVMASGYIMYSLYNVLLCMFLGLLTWYWIMKWCALP